jgi:hypothetical protein
MRRLGHPGPELGADDAVDGSGEPGREQRAIHRRVVSRHGG